MLKNDSIFVGADNSIWYRGLKADDAPTTYINSATITFSLYTSEANAIAETSAVSGASAISMPYVSGSNGDYRGILDDAVVLTNGSVYYLVVKVDAGSGKKDKRVIPYTARLRGNV